MSRAYLLMSLAWAAFAVLSARDRLFDAILAVGFAINAAVYWLKGRRLLRMGLLRDPARSLAKRERLVQVIDQQIRDSGIEVSSVAIADDRDRIRHR